MASHYASPCKQCCAFGCCAEIRVREEYIKWWKANGKPQSMSNHDCFKSVEERQRDIKTAAKSQAKDLEKLLSTGLWSNSKGG